MDTTTTTSTLDSDPISVATFPLSYRIEEKESKRSNGEIERIDCCFLLNCETIKVVRWSEWSGWSNVSD